MKRILSTIGVCILLLITITATGCFDKEEDSGKQSSIDDPIKLKELMDDWDHNTFLFKSFDVGDVVYVTDKITGFDAYNEDDSVYPFHLETEKDSATTYSFLSVSYYDYISGDGYEYLFACTMDISSKYSVGDQVVIKLTINAIGEFNEYEGFDGTILDVEITKA